jgi:hypothetical protein
VEGIHPGTTQADLRIQVQFAPPLNDPIVEENSIESWTEDAVRLSCPGIEFRRNAGTAYGFDKGGEVLTVTNLNGDEQDKRKFGPLHDYVSVCREKTTNIDAVITGILPKYVQFTDSPAIFTLSQKTATQATQPLEITGAAVDTSSPARLEAYGPSGLLINFLEVATYKNTTGYYTLYSVKHGHTDVADIARQDLSPHDVESFVNKLLTQAVIDTSITGPANPDTPGMTTVTVDYDLNGNGRLDILPPGCGISDEENKLRDNCVALRVSDTIFTIPIIYVHKLAVNYRLTDLALQGSTTIYLESSWSLHAGATYRIEGGYGIGEDVTIQYITDAMSIDGKPIKVIVLTKPIENVYLPNDGSLILTLAGITSIKGDKPVYTTDPELGINTIELLYTMAHEIGHTTGKMDDLLVTGHLMYFMECGKTTPANIRYRSIPKKNGGDDAQWQDVPR